MPLDPPHGSLPEREGEPEKNGKTADKIAKRVTRRTLLKTGAGLAAGIYGISRASGGLAQESSGATAKSESRRLPNRPNIIVLMTDQERHHMHWPAGWAEKNLPALQRLKRNGLYFNRAYTAVTQCSPSRAVMMTGRFAPINRVTTTFLWPGLVVKDRQPNIASLLREKAGYEAVWKGKWHLSYAANAAPGNGGEDWTTADIKAMETNYGWSRWNPPDGGNAIMREQRTPFGFFDGLTSLGGANPNNDGRYINGVEPGAKGQTPGFGESVVEFLKSRAGKRDKPFCLFVSLVNPHDVYVYPNEWKDAGYQYEAFANLGIELPPNYSDDLSTKPKVQKASRDAYQKFATLADAQAEKDYVNFYAYLNTLADRHIGTVLDTLQETGLMDDTIILRFADHGEGGLSHGMREKAYSMYEEMIHIPLVVHNPKLYPEPRETEAFYNHLDLLPTILELAGVRNANSYALGKSIARVIADPKQSTQDHLLFSFDDDFFLPYGFPGSHIRGLIDGDWTYAAYFSLDGGGVEYELYDRQADPLQMKNLLFANPGADVKKEWARLHQKMTQRFIDTSNLPNTFEWPISVG